MAPLTSVLAPLAVGMGIAAAWGALTAIRWRWMLAWLAVLQLAAFGLIWGPWPLSQAVAWLVASWFSTAMLGWSQRSLPEAADWLLGDRILRWAMGALGILVALSLAPALARWLPTTDNVRAWSGLVWLVLGWLHLGLSTEPLRVVTGLLTVLAGFLVLYAPLEASLLVTGLLTMLELGLALAGGYLVLLTGRGTTG